MKKYEISNHLRILFISSALERAYGGPPEAVVGACTAIARKKHQVSIQVFGQTDKSANHNKDFFDRLSKAGVRIHLNRALVTNVYGGIGALKDIANLRKSVKNSDWVSMHGIYKIENFITFIFTSYYKIPFSIMPHGTYTSYQQGVHKFRKKLIDFILLKTLIRSATRILVASNVEKTELMSDLYHKTVVVGLGINPPLALESTFKESDLYKFVYIGRLASKKRVDLSILAFEKICNRNPEKKFTLDIYGTGDERYVEELKNLASQSLYNQKICFKGWLDSKDKANVFAHSNCFLLTSEDENFANSVAEALSHGVPCVVSEKVALSNVIKIYKAGKTFSDLSPLAVSNAMQSVIDMNQDELRVLSLRAAEDLDWDSVADNWIAAMRIK